MHHNTILAVLCETAVLISDLWPGDKNFSILQLSCRTSDLQFSLVLHMYLSFKSRYMYNEEHKGVICYMTYKVPYITVKMIFSQSNS